MSENSPRDENHVPTVLFEISGSTGSFMPGQIDSLTGRILVDATSGSVAIGAAIAGGNNGLPLYVVGGLLAQPSDPNADRIWFWDDSASSMAWLAAGTGLTITNTTISATGSGGTVTSIDVSGGTTGLTASGGPITTNGTITLAGTLALANGGTGAVLVDPNADRIMFWDDSAGAVTWLTAGTGLTITNTTITASGGGIGGSDTQVQFNDAGAFGGDAGFVYNKTTDTATVGILLAVTSAKPSVSDAAALGSTALQWSDLFLAEGGVINWDNGDVTITQTSNILAIEGTTNVQPGTNDVGALGAAATSWADLFLASGAVINFNNGDVTITHASGNLLFAGASSGYTFDAKVYPTSDDGAALGDATHNFSDLFLASGAVINIANSNWVATHTSGILTVGTGDLRVTTAGTNTASVVTVGGTQTLTNKTLTSPTLTTPSAFTTGGTITLAENTSIALDPVLSADGKYTGITISGTAGATLAFGDLIYLAVADSRWELTDADSVTTAGAVWTGMCVLAAAADGDPTLILLQGNIRADANFPALTVGAPVYASTTPGDIQVAQPNGTDDVIHVVGFALTADSIYFNPSQDYITHT